MSSFSDSEKEHIRRYLETRNILIVDEDEGAKLSIHSVLEEMGSPKGRIFSSANFDNAIGKLLTGDGYPIIFAEYRIGSQFAINLSKLQIERFKDPRERIFILETANVSESSVADAAEGDIDGYLLKPFDAGSIGLTLGKIILRKIEPSEFMEKVFEGKSLVDQKKFDEAEKKFLEASKLNSKSALAKYHLGFCASVKGDIEKSLELYNEGLKINSTHYRCMIGRFEALDTMEKTDEAYTMGKKILDLFPISPQLSERILKLAVNTTNYSDIFKYFDSLWSVDHRTKSLKITLVAGLIVAARYFFKKELEEDAVTSLKKAVEVSMRNFRCILKSIWILIHYEKQEEAGEFLTYFREEDREKPEFQMIRYRVNRLKSEPAKSVEIGKKLIEAGQDSMGIYEGLILSLLEDGKKEEAKKVAQEAKQKHPNFVREFNLALEGKPDSHIGAEPLS